MSIKISGQHASAAIQKAKSTEEMASGVLPDMLPDTDAITARQGYQSCTAGSDTRLLAEDAQAAPATAVGEDEAAVADADQCAEEGLVVSSSRSSGAVRHHTEESLQVS